MIPVDGSAQQVGWGACKVAAGCLAAGFRTVAVDRLAQQVSRDAASSAVGLPGDALLEPSLLPA